MTLNDLLLFPPDFFFSRALVPFFSPPSLQDYIRDSVLFTKPTGSVKKASYIRPGSNSQPAGPQGGQSRGFIMFMSNPLNGLIGLAIIGRTVCVCGSSRGYTKHRTSVLRVCTLFIVNDSCGDSFSEPPSERSSPLSSELKHRDKDFRMTPDQSATPSRHFSAV